MMQVLTEGAGHVEFVCNIEVPRTDTDTGIPKSWIHDRAVGFDVTGFLTHVLVATQPGWMVHHDELGPRHPDDRPLSGIISDATEAGYLIELGDGRYELVHPARLGPPLSSRS